MVHNGTLQYTVEQLTKQGWVQVAIATSEGMAAAILNRRELQYYKKFV